MLPPSNIILRCRHRCRPHLLCPPATAASKPCRANERPFAPSRTPHTPPRCVLRAPAWSPGRCPLAPRLTDSVRLLSSPARNHFPRDRPTRTLVRSGRPGAPSSSNATRSTETRAPQPQDEIPRSGTKPRPALSSRTCLIDDVECPRHRERKARSHPVEMTFKLPRTDMIRVPCGSHLGRIARQDQSGFLPVAGRRQLTLAARFACPSRVHRESLSNQGFCFLASCLAGKKEKK